MKRASSFTLVLGSYFVLTLLYTNCSQVEFAARAESLNVNESLPGISGLPTGSEVETAIQNCAHAAQSGQMKISTVEIIFDDTRVETGNSNDICGLGPLDNFSIFSDNGYEGKIAARYEQSRKLNLPANAVVCDISVSNSLSSFKYDDLIYLTYNDYVIAGNHKPSITNLLEGKQVKLASFGTSLTLYKYDWSRLQLSAGSRNLDVYCLGSEQGRGACSLPPSEQQGQISLVWDPRDLIAVGLSAPVQAQELKFIVTGDNNTGDDCYHQQLKFDTTVKYYLKQTE